jgi:hypothetical protein
MRKNLKRKKKRREFTYIHSTIDSNVVVVVEKIRNMDHDKFTTHNRESKMGGGKVLYVKEKLRRLNYKLQPQRFFAIEADI